MEKRDPNADGEKKKTLFVCSTRKKCRSGAGDEPPSKRRIERRRWPSPRRNEVVGHQVGCELLHF